MAAVERWTQQDPRLVQQRLCVCHPQRSARTRAALKSSLSRCLFPSSLDCEDSTRYFYMSKDRRSESLPSCIASGTFHLAPSLDLLAVGSLMTSSFCLTTDGGEAGTRTCPQVEGRRKDSYMGDEEARPLVRRGTINPSRTNLKPRFKLARTRVRGRRCSSSSVLLPRLSQPPSRER